MYEIKQLSAVCGGAGHSFESGLKVTKNRKLYVKEPGGGILVEVKSKEK